MSKVKIEGNASGTGTFTIAAPNSSTDRTLTLPDEAGTVLTSASDIPSDNLTGSVTVDGSGRVGIGTSSPGSELHVAGQIEVTTDTTTPSGGSAYFYKSTAGATVSGYNTVIETGSLGSRSERMRIDYSGRVTMPYQPGFYTRRSVQGDNRAANAQEWSVTGTGSFNTGGHFNASNGRFTAPVSGKYVFVAVPGYKQTGIDFSWKFAVNGTTFNEPVRFLGALNSHSTATGAFVASLTAGDYVTVEMGSLHHANSSVNFFSGYLLG
jgi:hypothetical protein